MDMSTSHQRSSIRATKSGLSRELQQKVLKTFPSDIYVFHLHHWHDSVLPLLPVRSSFSQMQCALLCTAIECQRTMAAAFLWIASASGRVSDIFPTKYRSCKIPVASPLRVNMSKKSPEPLKELKSEKECRGFFGELYDLLVVFVVKLEVRWWACEYVSRVDERLDQPLTRRSRQLRLFGRGRQLRRSAPWRLCPCKVNWYATP